MRKELAVGLMGLWLGWSGASADVSEMIFYPEADFAEGIFHFNYQGEKNKNYGFMFEKGFDPERIVYVRPSGHRVEKMKDGALKVSFANTDRYSYLQRAYRDDFLVSDEKGIVKILLSGGDCKASPECVTAENILTVNVPKGYSVRSYQGLDQDLRPLKNPQWQRKGNTYTLTARDVKGACIMMELERLRPGQEATHPIMPSAVKVHSEEAPSPAAAEVQLAESEPAPAAIEPPVVRSAAVEAPAVAAPAESPAPVAAVSVPEPAPKPVPAAQSEAEKPAVQAVAAAPQKVDKPAARAELPAPYFRNFQLFETRSVVALNESGKERLTEWVRAFKAGGYASVVINGYTDDIPPQRLKHLYATNEILSAARAKAVAEYLSSQGIDPARITVNGLGALNPVAPNDTEEGRSKNRRIEFIVK